MLFNADMIRALLNTQVDAWPTKAADDGKPFKFQTRRIVKMIDASRYDLGSFNGNRAVFNLRPGEKVKTGRGPTVRLWMPSFGVNCPHPIDALIYAKETFAHIPAMGTIYRADKPYGSAPSRHWEHGWKSSIVMPRSAARIWLRVMNVRVERVNSITDADAMAEGAFGAMEYSILWEAINGKGSWLKNPWVWVYDLSRITKP